MKSTPKTTYINPTLRPLLVLIIAFLLPCALLAQTTAKTSEDVICTSSAHSELSIFVPSGTKVELKETKGSRILIETSISIEGTIKSVMLDFLVAQGRYSLVRTIDNQTIYLRLNDLKPIGTKTDGKTSILYERLTYTIYVPSNLSKVIVHEAFN